MLEYTRSRKTIYENRPGQSQQAIPRSFLLSGTVLGQLQYCENNQLPLFSALKSSPVEFINRE